jgi:hypothetical protein
MPSELKKNLLPVATLIALAMGLFAILMFVGQKQEIRPRAASLLSGNGDLLLSSDNLTPNAGQEFTVTASVRLNPGQTGLNTLRISGADITILYDKNLLEVTNVVPNVITSTNQSGAFTNAPIVSSGGTFDTTFNFLRVSEVARLSDTQLGRDTVTLATITFRAKSNGHATIKYPDDNNLMELVGKNVISAN